MAGSRPSERSRVERAAAALVRAGGGAPDVAVVLGSGLPPPPGDPDRRVPLRRIPGLPVPSVEGHPGEVLFFRDGPLRVAAFLGRVHLYEGWTPAEVVRAVRAAAAAGARTLVLANASGGLSPGARPGRVMVLDDHLDLGGGDPDGGVDPVPFGPRFAAMAGAYDRALRAAALGARAGRSRPFAGTYAFVRGPAFETPAEARMLRRLGADAVGMSTVPEVIAARRLGMRVAALSVIANRSGGPGDSHERVLRGVEAGADLLRAAIRRILSRVRREEA